MRPKEEVAIRRSPCAPTLLPTWSIRGVAAPVRTLRGEIKYALGLIGMFRRIDSDEFRAATAMAVQTAAALSEALGYRA